MQHITPNSKDGMTRPHGWRWLPTYKSPQLPPTQYSALRVTLQWRHNGRDGISNHQPHDCLFNLLFRHRSKKTSKLRVTGLCEGNSPVTGEFPTQMASNAKNVSIWWSHHELDMMQHVKIICKLDLLKHIISCANMKLVKEIFTSIDNKGLYALYDHI